MTVSYTHLDVYKRQDPYGRINRGREGFTVKKNWLLTALGIMPVSYTHLDVYKRQLGAFSCKGGCAMSKIKITPLYERLSRDDELQGESCLLYTSRCV